MKNALRLLIFSAASSLLAAAAGQERIDFSRLTSADGLAQDSVTSIIQDRLGLIWIPIEEPVSMYLMQVMK